MALMMVIVTMGLLAGCGDDTPTPVAVDIYIDTTFSNDQVAQQCINDILAATRIGAFSLGQVSVHTFDGDPLRRRGLSETFAESEVPRKYNGTSQYDDYLEEHAAEEAERLRPEIEELAAEPPVVGGSPLVGVLTRAARLPVDPSEDHRILICTDGLFTDVNGRTSDAEVRELGESLNSQLEGATVDFIGIANSAPQRGPTTEETRPKVEGLIALTGASMGNWDVELPPRWEQEMQQRAEGGDEA